MKDIYEYLYNGLIYYYSSERARCNINKITDSYWPKTFKKGLYIFPSIAGSNVIAMAFKLFFSKQ